ncbi:MAG: N-acetyltransferase [Thermoleophilia bacterium]|nr:N-acetyltransferase [Thermoleophilia bacterium]
MTDAAPLVGAVAQLHPISAADVDDLLALRASSPDALARWNSWTRPDIEDLLDPEGSDRGWWIVLDGERVGFIQHYQELEPDYRHAGIDIFVVEAAQGRGVGTDAIRTLATYLVRELGHHRLIIDPAADNLRAIRCYEKVGFRPVGRMRQYERGPDGSFHDGLLMDLLAPELT